MKYTSSLPKSLSAFALHSCPLLLSPRQVVRFDPVDGRFTRVPQDGQGRFTARFDSFGSAVYLVNTKIAADPAAPTFDFELANEQEHFTLKTGWTLTREKRYFAGSNRLERVEDKGKSLSLEALGDWRPLLGWHFSGIASYENEFEWTGSEDEFLLDLGKVAWTCRATFNGERLEDRFFGPFTWRVRPKKGKNRLLVTVANTLATTLSDDATRSRIHRDFYYPGILNYEGRQQQFDRHHNEGGLIGPVLFRPVKHRVPEVDEARNGGGGD